MVHKTDYGNRKDIIRRSILDTIEYLEKTKDPIGSIKIVIEETDVDSYKTIREYERDNELYESIDIYEDTIQDVIDSLTDELDKYTK